MAKAITVDVSEWEQWSRRLKRDADDVLDRHFRNAMDGSLDYVEELLVAETPVGVSGNLRAGWTQEITGAAFAMTGYVVNPLSYALPVDMGRRAVKWPSREAIQSIALWAKRKGLAGTPEEAIHVAWAVARSPTTGAHMVDKAYQEVSVGDKIEQIWLYELERAIEELVP